MGDWRFDAPRDNAFPNAAGPDLPARIVGEVAIVDSPQGKAVRLDGKGYLEVGNSPRLELTTGCTLAAWICPQEQTPGGGRIIDKSEVGTSNGYLLDTHPGNSLRLIVERGSPGFDARLQPGRWVHVAATADGEGGLAIYLDGKPVASTRQDVPVDVTAIQASHRQTAAFPRSVVRGGAGCDVRGRARPARAPVLGRDPRAAGHGA